METSHPLYWMSDIGCTLFWGFLPGILAFTFSMCSWYGSHCQAQVKFIQDGVNHHIYDAILAHVGKDLVINTTFNDCSIHPGSWLQIRLQVSNLKSKCKYVKLLEGPRTRLEEYTAQIIGPECFRKLTTP